MRAANAELSQKPRMLAKCLAAADGAVWRVPLGTTVIRYAYTVHTYVVQVRNESRRMVGRLARPGRCELTQLTGNFDLRFRIAVRAGHGAYR